jgi:short-subunit dehydrogenase
VVGMMEALRADLADTNIGVSIYCPNGVRSNILDSCRNRPRNLANTGFNQDLEVMARAESYRNNSELTMDPVRAGQFVLRGMRNNDLYILSHPESDPIIRDRNEALVTSFPSDWCLTQEQAAVARASYQPNIYRLECDRKLGAPATPSIVDIDLIDLRSRS